MRRLIWVIAALVLLISAPAAAQEATVGQDCPPEVTGAATDQYDDDPCVDSPAAAPDAAEDAARDAAKDAGGGEAAFERALGTADLARKYGMTRLPDTGGVPIAFLIPALALVGCAVLFVRSLRR